MHAAKHKRLPAEFTDDELAYFLLKPNVSASFSLLEIAPAIPRMKQLFSEKVLAGFLSCLNEFKDTSHEDIKQFLCSCRGIERDGLFVDVSGTLLLKGKLNIPLAGLIIAAQKKNLPVTVFSSGTPDDMVRELAALGLQTRVLPKASFIGDILPTLIDDCEGMMQGFVCRQQHDPLRLSAQILDKSISITDIAPCLEGLAMDDVHAEISALTAPSAPTPGKKKPKSGWMFNL